MSRKKYLMLLSLFLGFFVFLTPYVLSSGSFPVPSPFMQVTYSLGINYHGQGLSIPSQTFVLTTGNIVNSSYIEVTESVGAAAPLKFYVNLLNRTILLSKELLEDLLPHGEYYDLWIGERHGAGDAVKVLNYTTVLSNSGLKFHGWLFFNSLTTSKIPFNFSRNVTYQETNITADYFGEISITYDQETGLMIEDYQSWTVHFIYGSPQTIYYSVAITYVSSNVRFMYITYLLTTGIYTALVIIIASLILFTIYMLYKKKREKELAELPPEIPETPETPGVPTDAPAGTMIVRLPDASL